MIILVLFKFFNEERRDDLVGRTSAWDFLSWLNPFVAVSPISLDRSKVEGEIEYILSNDEELYILFREGILSDIPDQFYGNAVLKYHLSPLKADFVLRELLNQCKMYQNKRFEEHTKSRAEFYATLAEANKSTNTDEGNGDLVLEISLPGESLKKKSVRISETDPEIKEFKFGSFSNEFI